MITRTHSRPCRLVAPVLSDQGQRHGSPTQAGQHFYHATIGRCIAHARQRRRDLAQIGQTGALVGLGVVDGQLATLGQAQVQRGLVEAGEFGHPGEDAHLLHLAKQGLGAAAGREQ